MKSLIVVLAVVAALVAPLRAQTAPVAAAPTQADTLLGSAWTSLYESSSFHLLDNATPAYFYDAIHKESLAGVSTSLYYNSKAYTSLDFGVAGGSSSGTSNVVGFPLIAINFHAGSLIVAKSPVVASLVEASGASSSPVLSNLTFGGWAARDFNAGEWRAGAFSGFRFGSVTSN